MWYTSILPGFKLSAAQSFPDFGTALAILALPVSTNQTVHLELLYQNNSIAGAMRSNPPQHVNYRGISQFALQVEDLTDVILFFDSIEIPYYFNYYDTRFGLDEVFIRDLNGNIIEFVMYRSGTQARRKRVPGNPLGIISFFQVGISVSSLTLASEWYGQVFGLQLLLGPVDNYDHYNTSYAVIGWWNDDNTTFALPLQLYYQYNAQNGPWLPNPPGQTYYRETTQFSFLVQDMDETVTYVENMGIETLFAYTNDYLRLKLNFIRDMDGNFIEFIEEF
jgi:catechol 2,3-dioxygenase-like lactoylglutathione lyase family enzyme